MKIKRVLAAFGGLCLVLGLLAGSLFAWQKWNSLQQKNTHVTSARTQQTLELELLSKRNEQLVSQAILELEEKLATLPNEKEGFFNWTAYRHGTKYWVHSTMMDHSEILFSQLESLNKEVTPISLKKFQFNGVNYFVLKKALSNGEFIEGVIESEKFFASLNKNFKYSNYFKTLVIDFESLARERVVSPQSIQSAILYGDPQSRKSFELLYLGMPGSWRALLAKSGRSVSREYRPLDEKAYLGNHFLSWKQLTSDSAGVSLLSVLPEKQILQTLPLTLPLIGYALLTTLSIVFVSLLAYQLMRKKSPKTVTKKSIVEKSNEAEKAIESVQTQQNDTQFEEQVSKESFKVPKFIPRPEPSSVKEVNLDDLDSMLSRVEGTLSSLNQSRNLSVNSKLRKDFVAELSKGNETTIEVPEQKTPIAEVNNKTFEEKLLENIDFEALSEMMDISAGDGFISPKSMQKFNVKQKTFQSKPVPESQFRVRRPRFDR